MNKKKLLFFIPLIALILGVFGGYFSFKSTLEKSGQRVVRKNCTPFVQPDRYSKHTDFSITENEKVYLVYFTNKRTSNLAMVKMDCYVTDEGHHPTHHNTVKIGRQDLVKVLEYNKKQTNPNFPASSRIAFNVEGFTDPGWGFVDTDNIIEEENDWWLIRTESGKFGWVPNEIFFNDNDINGAYRVKKSQSAFKQDANQINKQLKSVPVQNINPTDKSKSAPDYMANQMSPKNAFFSFHKAITNKQLRTAYTILSPDYQRFVGGFEKFAPGYDNTISSEIVELKTLNETSDHATYTYKLKAVDREGGGTKTQYFIGKAKLIKIDGQWRIDSTEAKKASQNSSLPTNTVNSTVSKAKTVGTITGNDVNVRKGPGVDYKSLGVFFKGDKVRIINSSRNSLNETWYKIEFDNPTAGLIVGWVRSDFININ